MKRRPRDSGNAIVEVALLAPIMLVPLAWCAISVAAVTSAQSAAIAAARQASRAFVLAQTPFAAQQSARRVAASVIASDGHNLRRPTVTITCVPQPCLAPNSRVDVTVTTSVTLGFLPVPLRHAPTITIRSTQSALVDPFRE